MILSRETILAELKYCYPDSSTFTDSKLSEYTEEQLFSLFNKHCSDNSFEIEASELVDNYSQIAFLIDTPDGFQSIKDFYIKSPRTIYEVFVSSNESAKVSEDHLFETTRGWIKAKNLLKTDSILTRSGFYKITKIKIFTEKEQVYDWEVLHDNHRYWAGSLSSHNTGKTFLCLNAVRNFQNAEYYAIYIDTEGAIDTSDFVNFGCDLEKLSYRRMNKISDVKFFIYDFINTYKENPGLKIVIFVDSIGLLDTDKTERDLEKGKNAADMGLKAKELRALFRSFTLSLSNIRVPFIFTNHTSATMDEYNPKTASGGGGPEFSASTILMLSKGVLRDENKTKTGIIVRSKTFKNRLAKPIDIEFHISSIQGMNKFVGLQDYVSWENCGIGRGKKITEKEFLKLKPDEQEKCSQFTIDSETFYFLPGALARNYINRHNGDVIPTNLFFTERLFTKDVLLELDEKVIKPMFKYPTNKEEIQKLEMEELDSIHENNESDLD